MNIIKCPECKGIDLVTYDTKGCIEDGEIIEEKECLSCNHTFTVRAVLSNIKIEKE